ncbi:DUF559 domain-containing protein [Bosea psychrotolerans]|uniref:DUF559 domain-containing protein n=1 Tax=Bosea psychrotolerans TaxID=1871628 RepID=UPI003CCC02C2
MRCRESWRRWVEPRRLTLLPHQSRRLPTLTLWVAPSLASPRWAGEGGRRSRSDEGSQVLERKNSPETLDFARRQRGQPIRAETASWQAVRSRRFHGLKFKRQAAIWPS